MLEGKKLLITAGPTWEALDPVRGLTNRSSGKMGYALAEVATAQGADVTLVSGPTCLPCPTGVERIDVRAALDMHEAVMHRAQSNHVFISVAAVADYRPAKFARQKIKKGAEEITLKLVKNPDIVASVAALTEMRPFTVGFAAETHDVIDYARSKLERKNLDMIAANDVSQPGIGFGSDTNRLYLITRDATKDLGVADKRSLALGLLSAVSKYL